MIKLNNITKKYKENIILENASYAFPEKGIVCLMGASGGGKTTLLNLLAGFDSEYDGEINVAGNLINTFSPAELCDYRRQYIGCVFQDYHLLYGYTVLENVLLPIARINDTERERATKLLETLGILGKANEKVENLSGGQKQRVAIARAIINEPTILVADEPTGALDRKTATEIMKLLTEIAKTRLVLVITHDIKITEYGNEIIQIVDKKISIIKHCTAEKEGAEEALNPTDTAFTPHLWARAKKNFSVHLTRYIGVAISISIGILAFLFSLSFGNVSDISVEAFKEKNTAFSNGYVKLSGDKNDILDTLKADERLENIYLQYKMNDVKLAFGDKNVTIAEKFPLPKATENLSYGVMPKIGKNEIALTGTVAKQFSKQINELIGKEVTLTAGGETYTLTISGIYNAAFDDYFVSADIEQEMYKNTENSEPYSLSYDVKDFENIPVITNELTEKDIKTETATKEVSALLSTFETLKSLFAVVSVLVLLIGIFICSVLIIKLQNSRYGEVGLLSALGFNKQKTAGIIKRENVMLSAFASGVSVLLLLGTSAICSVLSFPFTVSALQLILSVAGTFILLFLITTLASWKLLRTEPAKALRK